MSQCDHYKELHKNASGSVGYCYECAQYHLRIKGLLTILEEGYLTGIENHLQTIQSDLEETQDVSDVNVGIQIKLSSSTYLCLSYAELVEAVDLIHMAQYMKKVNELVEQ